MLRHPAVPFGPDCPLALTDAARIAVARAAPELTPAAYAAVDAARTRLQGIIDEARHVYGVTTGFGPLANRLVPPNDAHLLQQNLVHHLASGVGPNFAWAEARAIVLARLTALAQGWSGVSQDAVEALVAVLVSPLAPALPSIGTVGASGDLTPLAHLALCLQGRGAFLDRTGAEIEGPEALRRIGIAPIALSARDGLALVNGTSAMTGLAVLSADEAARALRWSVALTAALAELLGGRAEAWSAEFGAARPHPGQIWALDQLRGRITGAPRITSGALALSQPTVEAASTTAAPGQDAYTLRCAPQVIGAAADLLVWHDRIAETELNAVTDNPILPPACGVPALHGGNFMGQHVALSSDALATALTVLAGLAERQIARVTDEKLNGGLPPFLQRGPAGLNSGLMGAQVTATALVAEMRSQGPAAVQSLSTNGANQDVVSMGTLAARRVRLGLNHLARVQAILALAVAQGLDIVEARAPAARGGAFSHAAQALRDHVRALSPEMQQDRPLGEEIEAVASSLRSDNPPG